MSAPLLQRVAVVLFCLFCLAYPIAVIGVAFDVRPPFSMTWAGGALLILEGTMLGVATIDEYGAAGLLAALAIAGLAYAVEALGVNTGFPFGSYRYTDALSAHLPGGVPLAVIFAWLMIILSMRGLSVRPPLLVGGRLLTSIAFGALCATLLDLVLEPVAFHIEHYWEWLAPGRFTYYGVPWENFVAWFGAALLILACVTLILLRAASRQNLTSLATRLPLNLPTWLYFANVLMFGLVDLTHGYYLATAIALFALILPIVLLSFVLAPFPGDTAFAVIPAHGIEQYQALQPKRKRVKKAKKAGRKQR
jgi:uncharacterized membrane protein